MNFPLRVLHLEDDARDTELVQAALEGEGIQSELTRVEREEDFLAALKRESLDLILADYTLPSFDGLSALRIASSTCRMGHSCLFPERSVKTSPLKLLRPAPLIMSSRRV